MSESAPPPDAGGTAGRPEAAALTPETIEAVLDDFRGWLTDLAAGRVAAPPPEPDAETVDLATLVGQFTALRHEVNLQTRAVRAQQEQNAETLRQLAQAVETLRQPPVSASASTDDELRPLLQTLVETHDALARAAAELQRVAVVPQEQSARRTPWWAKVFGHKTAHPPGASQPGAVITSTAAGLAMSVQRVERALSKHDLRPIPTTGELFDPERMEVVEAVAGTGRPSGEVIEEVRRGYTWRGRVFRYAQVRVAK
jgi:molecular chaperone GrpE